MNLETKINSVLIEYVLRKDNFHIGSGLGGNITYFMYLQNKGSIISSDVNDVLLTDSSILWNPDFLLKSKNEIRKILDPLIEERIKKEGFQSPILDDFKINYEIMSLDEPIKDLNIENLLLGKVNFPDLNLLNENNKLFLCMRICAKFAEHLDRNPDAKKYYKPVADILNKFDIKTVIWSFRREVSLERLIKHNLDESNEFSKIILLINSLI